MVLHITKPTTLCRHMDGCASMTPSMVSCTRQGSNFQASLVSLHSGLPHPPRLMLLPRPLAPAGQDGVRLGCRRSRVNSGPQVGSYNYT